MRGGSRFSKYCGILEATRWSLKMLEILSKSRPCNWLLNFIFINCVLGGSCGMRGKSLLNEKAIIIFSINQSECRKLLRSASSRIGVSLDTGTEESACDDCWLFAKGHPRTYSVFVFSSKVHCGRIPWDRRFLRTSGFNKKTMLEVTDGMFPCWYIWSLRPSGNGQFQNHGIFGKIWSQNKNICQFQIGQD